MKGGTDKRKRERERARKEGGMKEEREENALGERDAKAAGAPDSLLSCFSPGKQQIG